MRFGLASILGLLALAMMSCGGGTAGIAPQDQVQQTIIENNQDTVPASNTDFGSLPSPRVVNSANPDGGTRSFNAHVGSFYSTQDGEGFEIIHPKNFVQFEAMSDDVLPHDFLFFPRIRDQESRAGQISFDFDWTGEAPTGQYGFYVGFADHDTDRWVWRGPIQEASDFVDFTDMGYEENERVSSSDLLVVVNYSRQEALVRYMYLNLYSMSDTPGDEWLYFVQQQGDTQVIKRAPSSDLMQQTTIITGQPDVEFGHIEPVEINNQWLLIFNRRAPGGNWEIWQSRLDGFNPRLHRSAPGGVEFIGLNVDGDRSLCFQDKTGTDDVLVGYPLDGSNEIYQESMKVSELTETEAYMWPGYDYYILGVLPESSGAEKWGIMTYIDHDLLEEPFMRCTTEGESGNEFADIFHFTWASTFLGASPYYMYSFKESASDNFRVVLYDARASWDLRERDLLTNEEFDLRNAQMSPDNLQLSVLAAESGMESGDLYVMPMYSLTLDGKQPVASNVLASAWLDPTPPGAFEF